MSLVIAVLRVRIMSLFSNLTVVKKRRLQDLKVRENGHFDLEFIKAMPPEQRNQCLDLLSVSTSQLRQDIFALCQVNFKTGGYFIEFGATNGIELNNTQLMERRYGWQGILAEPGRSWHSALEGNRTCTIDKRCVWSRTGERLSFTETPHREQSGISTFVKPRRRVRGTSYDVETISLNDLLDQHGAPDVIDYASVDTEGSEFDILNAVDFGRWQFRVMTVEHNFAPQRADIHALLTGHGYIRVLEDVSRFDDWYLGPAA